MQVKRFVAFVAAAFILAAFLAPVWAWEFEMRGEYENRFRYFGRTGTTDLFGISTLQDAGANTWVGFAGPSIYNTGFWPGNFADQASGGWLWGTAFPQRITRGGFSTWGSDAIYNDSKLILYPVIRVNRAIRVYGAYNIGGLRHKYHQSSDFHLAPHSVGAPPLERYYMSQTSMNAYDGTLATWEQFRLNMTIPWGVLSVGMRDFPFGTGATFGYNTRMESLMMVAPFGPLTIAGACWLARGWSADSWETAPDKDTKNDIYVGGFLTYESGPLSMGTATIWRKHHQGAGMSNGPARANIIPIFATNIAQTALDQNYLMNMAYFKFYNGRFFANGEYAWINQDTYTIGAPPLYVESQHAFAEMGVTVGPMKVSTAWAWAPGDPLNDGNATKMYAPFCINYQAMEPYEWLMFRTYGGGTEMGFGGALTAFPKANPTTQTFVNDENGMMADAWALAGRVDYAVASNLNIWASYIWAHRVETAGYFAGGYNHTLSPVAAGPAFMAQYGGTTPYVPDGFIGWESDAGVDWKLLEGMTAKFRYAYWQPGSWYDYAYQSIGMVNGAVVPSAIVKGRDPIQAFEGKIVVEF